MDLSDALTENSIPVVKSAGNNFISTPATDIGTGVCTELGVNCVFIQSSYRMNAPGVIVVGAVESDGTHATYSSSGTNLWISARTGTLTTDIEGCSYNTESQIMDSGTCNYVVMGGTSAAAPSATGVTALVLEAAGRNLTVSQVKYILAKSAVNYKSDSAMRFFRLPLQGDAVAEFNNPGGTPGRMLLPAPLPEPHAAHNTAGGIPVFRKAILIFPGNLLEKLDNTGPENAGRGIFTSRFGKPPALTAFPESGGLGTFNQSLHNHNSLCSGEYPSPLDSVMVYAGIAAILARTAPKRL